MFGVSCIVSEDREENYSVQWVKGELNLNPYIKGEKCNFPLLYFNYIAIKKKLKSKNLGWVY
jgi:hypothetical protein